MRLQPFGTRGTRSQRNSNQEQRAILSASAPGGAGARESVFLLDVRASQVARQPGSGFRVSFDGHDGHDGFHWSMHCIRSTIGRQWRANERIGFCQIRLDDDAASVARSALEPEWEMGENVACIAQPLARLQ